jgi:hypothetical protein
MRHDRLLRVRLSAFTVDRRGNGVLALTKDIRHYLIPSLTKQSDMDALRVARAYEILD